MKSLLLMLVLVGVTVGMAGGAMIANEPFEGPDANDVNASTGGTGWAGGWVDSNAVRI